MSKITIPGNSILLLEGWLAARFVHRRRAGYLYGERRLFPAVAGVSAGSLNALNYASHQPGRSASINLRYRHDSRYFGPKAALRGGSVFGLQFMLHDVKKGSAVRRGDLRPRRYAGLCGGDERRDRQARLL